MLGPGSPNYAVVFVLCEWSGLAQFRFRVAVEIFSFNNHADRRPRRQRLAETDIGLNHSIEKYVTIEYVILYWYSHPVEKVR